MQRLRLRRIKMTHRNLCGYKMTFNENKETRNENEIIATIINDNIDMYSETFGDMQSPQGIKKLIWLICVECFRTGKEYSYEKFNEKN